MADEQSLKGFLKGLFGLNEAQAESPKPNPLVESPSLAPTQPMSGAKPKTEAYLNRKKGRRPHDDAMEYWRKIVDCIEREGEIAPGDLARELGLPKSTLIYNLNRLLDLCQGVARKGDNYFFLNHVFRMMRGKRLVRVGGGKYVRYKLEELPKAQEGPNEGSVQT